ncbi:MAG TPA: hypothetical protein VF376_00305, partial [Thermoanaerobaculia bacterium]
RPAEFMNVSFEYAATFQAAIWRTPGAPGPRPSPSRPPREKRTPTATAGGRKTPSPSPDAVLTRDRWERVGSRVPSPDAV